MSEPSKKSNLSSKSENLWSRCRRWGRAWWCGGVKLTSVTGAAPRRARSGRPARVSRRPCLERLEHRAVPAIDFLGSTATSLVVNLPDTDDAQDDDTELRLAAGNLIVHSRNGEHADVSASVAGLTTITVNSRGGDDLVTLDASLSSFGGTLGVNGGAGADTVRVGAGVRLSGVGATHSVGVELTATGARLNLDANSTFDFVGGVAGAQIETDGFELTTGDATSTTFAGTISGSGRVRKVGGGAWTLDGPNSYSGTTTITGTGSELRVNGSLGASGVAGAVSVASGAKLSGRGVVNANVTASAGSTIEATGDGLTLGSGASNSGFETTGTLRVGTFSVTLRDANAALLGASTTLAGGVLTATGGVSLSSGDVLSGFGTVAAAIDGNSGRIQANTAGQTLTVGVATSNSGVVGGDLQVDSGAALALLDANGAVVNHALVNGRLTAATGITIAAGKSLSGTGVVQGPTVVSGSVAPGAGGLGRLSFQGNLSLAGAAVFELGGTTPGAPSIAGSTDGYDQLLVAGTVQLTGASLSLVRVGDFLPTGGRLQSFVLIDNDGAIDPVIGTFAGLPEGAIVVLAGVPLFVSYSGGDGNDVVLSTQPIVPGTAANDFLQISYVPGAAGSDQVVVVRTNTVGMASWTFGSPLPAVIHVRAGAGDDRVVVNDASGGGTGTGTGGTRPAWELRLDGAVPGAVDVGRDSLEVQSATPLVADTGVTLTTVAGVSLEYGGFETVDASAVATRVIDDGDRGFELAPGPAAWRVQPQGYAGDSLEPINRASGAVARWRFDSLPVGSYRLSTSFLAAAARPAQTPLRVYDGDRLLTTLWLDQREPPDDERRWNADWKMLATLPVTTHRLTLELVDSVSSGSPPTADAMRLDWVSSGGAIADPPVLAPPRVTDARTIDDGDVGFATTGAWSLDSLGVQGDSRRRGPGDGSSTANWTFTGLAAGYYQVFATWPEKIWENTATASYAIVDADGAHAASVDQRYAPNDLSDGRSAWERLGAPVRVASVGGEIRVTLRDDQAANLAVADAIRVERLLDPNATLATIGPSGGATIVAAGDRVELGATTQGGPALERTLEIRNYGTSRLAIGSIGLPSGFELATSAPTEVSAASGVGYGSTTFRVRLPSTTIGSYVGALTLVSGDADGAALSVLLAGEVLRLGSGDGAAAAPEMVVEDVASGGVILAGGEPLALGRLWPGETVVRSFTLRNLGVSPLAVAPPLLPLGYELLAAPAASVPSGGVTSFTIGLRTDLAPNDYTGDMVLNSNDSDEGRFAFRVSTQVMARVFEVDDGDPSFSASGAFTHRTGSGYGGDLRLASAGDGGTATWTFPALAAGVYQVGVTWPHGASPDASNLASDATYRLTYGHHQKTLRVDQRQAPNDAAAAGAKWEEFVGRVDHPGGDLVVTLSAAAGGYVAADAVRVAWLDQPEIQMSIDGVAVTSRATTLTYPRTFIGDSAAGKTLVIENVGVGTLTLPSTITAPAGFRVTSDSGETALAGGARRTLVVRLDTDPASPAASGGGGGAKSGELTLATNDVNEANFSLTLAGYVETVMIVDQAQPTLHVSGRAASYSATAGFRSVSGGYLGRSQYSTAAASNTATFTLAGLPAGVFQVSTTYLPRSTWATNAPFRVNGGSVLLVNQQSAPGSVVNEAVAGQVASWQNLGDPIQVNAGGTITVVVGGVAANKYVTADAIRVQWLAPPVVLPAQPAASLASPVSRTAAATPSAVASVGAANANANSQAPVASTVTTSARDAWFAQLGIAELRSAASWADRVWPRRRAATIDSRVSVSPLYSFRSLNRSTSEEV